MTFVCANVNEGLPFADGSFDLIVSKACLDAILQQQNNARRMMAECHRLLKDATTTTLTATMICITHGNPESRLVHFENARDEWWDNVGIYALANNREGPKYVSDEDWACFFYTSSMFSPVHMTNSVVVVVVVVSTLATTK
jgi:ubiquinone/menaquinone biosynthesis C-methylase UbiE